jgi:hypothetical protein
MIIGIINFFYYIDYRNFERRVNKLRINYKIYKDGRSKNNIKRNER